MKVCNLLNGRELHADIHGHPFIMSEKRVYEVYNHVDEKEKTLVNTWQSKPENDCLRARGDIRWRAACDFTARPILDLYEPF